MGVKENKGCLTTILRVLGLRPRPDGEETWPYRVRDDFLSSAELSFYHVLRTAVEDWATVCPKVSLNDLFYAKSGDHKKNVAYRNKVARKHVDFLLCNPRTMAPLLGIELDDSSHRQASRQERDHLVQQVFAAAGLPLQRIPVQATYNVRDLSAALKQSAGLDEKDSNLYPDVPAAAVGAETKAEDAQLAPPSPSESAPPCPKCGQPMVLRVGKKEGPRKGKEFWGCRDYPRCRGLREYVPGR